MTKDYTGEKKIINSHKGEKSDDWFTPKWLYEDIKKEFNINFDPCPYKDEDKQGLFIDWGKRVFVNPPYSNIEHWFNKAKLELKKGNSEVIVFLVFSRTGTKWFHKYIWNKEVNLFRPRVDVRFLRGRLKFGNSKNSAPADSMIVIMT